MIGEATCAGEEVGNFVTGDEIVATGVVDFAHDEDAVVFYLVEFLINAHGVAGVDDDFCRVCIAQIDAVAGGGGAVIGGGDFDV